MTKANNVEKYVKECFEELSINYRDFFCYYELADDEEQGEWIETSWQNKDGSVNLSAVKHASIVLGISEKDILSTSEKAIRNILHKYPYYGFIKPFELSYKKSFYGKGFDEIHLFETIFEEKSKIPYPQRYDYVSIKKRLYSELKELSSSMKDIYHEGCTIEKLKITTNNFCSFDEITEMVNSYLLMISKLKKLFVKAIHNELSEEEIFDYNLLVSTFGLRDRYYTKCFLYYDEILKIKNLYNDITVDNFFDDLSFKYGKNFQPWRCSEFARNKSLVKNFVDALPEAKGLIGEYAAKASQFLCLYKWSDSDLSDFSIDDAIYMHTLCDDFDVPEIERTALPERFYVKKTADEMLGDIDVAEALIKYSRPQKLGGIAIKTPASFSSQKSLTHITFISGKINSFNYLENIFSGVNRNLSLKGEPNDE